MSDTLSDAAIDTLLSISQDVQIGNRTFTIGRASLGKTLLLQRAVRSLIPHISSASKLEADFANLFAVAGLFRLASQPDGQEPLLELLAIHLSNTRHELTSASHRQELKAYLAKHLTPQQLTALVSAISTVEDIEPLLLDLGITAETNRLERAVKAKGEGSTVSFCGRTLWGSLIDVACERYGWTMDYVLWGISYANLRLLIADHRKEVYLTDKERRQAKVSTDGIVVNGDDPQAIKALFRNLGLGKSNKP